MVQEKFLLGHFLFYYTNKRKTFTGSGTCSDLYYSQGSFFRDLVLDYQYKICAIQFIDSEEFKFYVKRNCLKQSNMRAFSFMSISCKYKNRKICLIVFKVKFAFNRKWGFCIVVKSILKITMIKQKQKYLPFFNCRNMRIGEENTISQKQWYYKKPRFLAYILLLYLFIYLWFIANLIIYILTYTKTLY